MSLTHVVLPDFDDTQVKRMSKQPAMNGWMDSVGVYGSYKSIFPQHADDFCPASLDRPLYDQCGLVGQEKGESLFFEWVMLQKDAIGSPDWRSCLALRGTCLIGRDGNASSVSVTFRQHIYAFIARETTVMFLKV